eukprot:scaffold3991_cov239-Chaetoceros_neogracile.AAC.4
MGTTWNKKMFRAVLGTTRNKSIFLEDLLCLLLVPKKQEGSEPVQEVEFKVSSCKKHQGLTPLPKSEVHPRKREGSAVIINPLTLEEGQKGD